MSDTGENREYQANLEVLVSARTEQLRHAVMELEKSHDITLDALVHVLGLKHAEAARHSKRVTSYAIAIARAMALPADEIRVIARGAFLHDIGKLATPEHILLKPSSLSEAEIKVMRQHCVCGYETINRIPYLIEAAEIVYSHHEGYNGAGYPRGLKGDEIPVGARIVAVANTLDSMTSNHAHRRRVSFSAACDEISRCSGGQFDPLVVRVFLAMPENVWSDLRKDVERD
ncbi:MAG: HD-GYP domain-containing protein [Terriglobales bacterium]